MNKYRWSIIGGILAVILWVFTIFLNLDLFEAFSFCLQQHERIETDELIFPAVLFYLGVMIDLARRHQKNRIELEQMKIYRSMLQAMHHILNNFLQKMLLFKLTADQTEGFDPQILQMYDTIIADTVAQIRALECIEKPDEESILKTVQPTR